MWVRGIGVASAMAIAIALVSASGHQLSGGQKALGPQVVTVDLVKARPGERDRLIRFYRANWARARATVLAARGIAGYRMLISADTGSRWDVALETTYPDSASWSRAEETFAPVLKAQGRTLIDGKTRADIADIVESRTLTVDP